MTDTTLTPNERRAEIMRHALMEAGADPEAVVLVGGAIYSNTGQVDVQLMWRAYVIAVEAVPEPVGWRPYCLACFGTASRDVRPVDSCQSAAPFTRDCGAAARA